VFLDEKGRYKRFVNNPCGSMWFNRFREGCSKRMVHDWRPNKALSLNLLLRLLFILDQRIQEATSPEEKNRWTVAHLYVAVSYDISLRGPKGFFVGPGIDVSGIQYKLRYTPN